MLQKLFILIVLGLASPNVEAAVYLVDFGVIGSQTTVDANNNTWNNLIAPNNDVDANLRSGTLVLNDITGAAGISMIYSFPTGGTNFSAKYGFTQNTNSLANLGLMNIASAKNDGIWSQGPATLTFSGLDASLTYSFSIFAHRVNSPERTSNYQLSGLTDSAVVNRNVATTLNNGGELVEFLNYKPNASGQIVLTLTAGSGAYAYINDLQIVAAPEPGRCLLMLTGVGLVTLSRRRRA